MLLLRLFFDRSEEAVLRRLREAHRFAARVQVVDVRWKDARGGPEQARPAQGP